MSRGGRRPGAGRPRQPPTKAIRLPVSEIDRMRNALDAIDSLQGVIDGWQFELNKSQATSKTGTHARTFDKAVLLLNELRQLMEQI